ncbi:MAG: SH3 domain-containing protein, partial [Bradyrhizobium sp.]
MALRTHALIGGLILAALVPTLTLGALWLGLISMTGSKPAVPPSESQAAASSAVLTAPGRIDAVLGENVSFPIALDGTDGVPSRSVIAIRGLPHGSNFSDGRPFGDSEWNLRPDQIGDLHLVLPAGATGEFKVGIALIAPDNSIIAEAATLLAIAPAPAAPTVSDTSDGAAAVPDGGEAAPPPLPDGVGVAASMPVADAAAAAEPEVQSATKEALSAPPGDAPTDKIEPPIDEANPPPGAASLGTVEQTEDGESGLDLVQPSVFVNLREAPSSSAPVVGVIAKGAKLSVLDRKRGWVQVTDPGSGKKGWIYSGLLAGEPKSHYRRKRAAPGPAAAEQNSESFWSRVG